METCCFTGHRSIPEQERAALTERLRETLRGLIAQGVRHFAAGGALGFDTLAAQTVLSLKAEFPEVKLILVLPCRDQTRGWSTANVATYESILLQADKVVWLAPRYYKGCMLARNRRLVEHADVCVAYLNDSQGGTAYTVAQARQKGIPVINLAN